MKVEPKSPLSRPHVSRSNLRRPAVSAPTWPTSPTIDAVINEASSGVARFLGCACGHLDVFGGSADYTGSLTLSLPIDRHVCVSAARAADSNITIKIAWASSNKSDPTQCLPISALFQDGGEPIGCDDLPAILPGELSKTSRCVIATLVELFRDGVIDRTAEGMSVVLSTGLDELPGTGAEAAASAATLVAVTGASGRSLDVTTAVNIVHRVVRCWMGLPVGLADAACVLRAAPTGLTCVCAEPLTINDAIELPDGIALFGMATGTLCGNAQRKYDAVRIASHMGGTLVDRIIRHENKNRIPWSGRLAEVSVADYVNRFRDRLPTKLKGSEFLKLFGETGDTITRIDPDVLYKVRSRTEHHVYENDRAQSFARCMQRAATEGDLSSLRQAGELMYASHWSYGQRCGLGSIETDLLVRLIRSADVDAGILGARITGHGCGGVVAVLMENTDRAADAIRGVVDEYGNRTSRTATILQSGGVGALVLGVRPV